MFSVEILDYGLESKIRAAELRIAVAHGYELVGNGSVTLLVLRVIRPAVAFKIEQIRAALRRGGAYRHGLPRFELAVVNDIHCKHAHGIAAGAYVALLAGGESYVRSLSIAAAHRRHLRPLHRSGGAVLFSHGQRSQRKAERREHRHGESKQSFQQSHSCTSPHIIRRSYPKKSCIFLRENKNIFIPVHYQYNTI